MSVVSGGSDSICELQNEALILQMTNDMMWGSSPFGMSELGSDTITSDLVRLPCVHKLSPCVHRPFKRRLCPRQLGTPVPEEPFPLDCLPLSEPVVSAMPPAGEISALFCGMKEHALTE